jgi:hypothetical protein
MDIPGLHWIIDILHAFTGKSVDFYVNLAAGFAQVFLVAIAVFFRDAIVRTLFVPWHALTKMFVGRPFVLIWNDYDRSVSVHIARALSSRLTGYRFTAVDITGQILHYRLRPWCVAAIILIDTDVTKFSDKEKTREQIEDNLMTYLEHGGGLVGTHDINYRRVRNKRLQLAFGCEVSDFVRLDVPVDYILNGAFAGHKLTAGLPENFQLKDGEIISGRWEPSVKQIYRTSDGRPLVTGREHGGGRLVWLNSGDTKDTLCESLATPQENLVTLLANAVEWVTTTEAQTLTLPSPPTPPPSGPLAS